MDEFGVPAHEDPHDTHYLIEGVRQMTAEFLRSRGTRVVDPAGWEQDPTDHAP